MWVGLGLPAPDFWGITLREADVVMRAASERMVRAKRMDDARTYTLASLISWSVNDPKAMPKFEAAFPDGVPKVAQDPEAIWESLAGWMETANELEARRNG